MWIWSRVSKDKFSLDLKFVLFVFKIICCGKHAKMFLLLYQRPTTVLQRKGHQNLKWGMRHSTSKHNIYCRTQCLNIAVNNFYLTNYLFIFKKRELQRRVDKPQLMCFMRQGKTIWLKKAGFFPSNEFHQSQWTLVSCTRESRLSGFGRVLKCLIHWQIMI